MNNRVSGNYIGTDASGTKALGNERNGISIRDGAQNNPVGGSSVAERNLVSGNERNGVEIAGTDTMSNTVSANYIGTDVTGTEALGNERDGVHISSSAQNNRVGGSDVAERNLISGNGRVGISINGRDDGTNSNNIQGNYIGVNISGTSSIANGTADEYTAIEIYYSANNTVTKNLVSGNIGSGILIQGDTSTGNSILANYIGTDKTGTKQIANTAGGIRLENGANHNEIGGVNSATGGACSGDCNLISGNGRNGIFIQGTDTVSNTVKGNHIRRRYRWDLHIGQFRWRCSPRQWRRIYCCWRDGPR